MNGGKPVRVVLAVLVGWTILREAEVGPLRSLLHGPAFGKLAYWIVIVGASLLTLWRAHSIRGREGLAWGLIGTGSLLWACGDVYWTLVLAKDAVIPVPSVSDAGYLAFYPLVFAGLCLLLRARVEGAPRTLWVDGLTAALAAGAMSAAVVLQAVMHTVGGNALGVATNLAYPVGDLILLAVVVASFALRGWRADRTWALLGLGIVLFWIADSYYLITVANETYAYPSVWDGGWTSCLVLFSAAAWQPARRTVAVEDRGATRFTAFPIAFATLGLGILVLAALGSLNPLAVVLAAASLLAVFGRLVLSLRENAGMLVASRYEALTDALTDLGNRRALTRDLDRVAAGQREGAVLALFDLDGFKHYNDSYGHPAGDALLQRLGAKLAAHVVGAGSAYRMGGDEFCVLLGLGADPVEQAAALRRRAHRARRRLRHHLLLRRDHRARRGPGRRRGPAHRRPAHVRPQAQRPQLGAQPEPRRPAARAGRAQPRAGRAHQRRGRAGRGRGAAPGARHRADRPHPPRRRAARRGQDGDPRRDPRQARRARRRRVGVHPPPHDHRRAHRRGRARPAPGRRPRALQPRALGRRRLPRRASSGEDIPLGARIVSVCDAFDAMVADRPYRAGMDAADALTELERCSGSQFDPAVVAAFAAAWAGQPRVRAAA